MPIHRSSPSQGPRFLPPAESRTAPAQSAIAQQIPLMDEHRNLAPLVNVRFSARCPKELTEIAPYVFRAFNKVAKPGFNKIHVKPISEDVEHERGTLTEATTEPHPALRSVTIEIGGHAEPELSHDQKLARYALDLTHEAFLHGAYYFDMFDKHEKGSHEPFKSEVEQHQSIVYPPNDHNPYLNIVRHVLQHLPDRNALRVEFLKAYANDVYSHMVEDLSEEAQIPVREWLGRLDDRAEHPRDLLWSAQADTQQRTNITQVLMGASDHRQMI